MLRVLSPIAATIVFATALGAAPGNSTPESLKGAPGQTQENEANPDLESRSARPRGTAASFSIKDCKRRTV